MIAPGMDAAEREMMRQHAGNDPARYARWPGIASCATKMLTGRACASRHVPTEAELARATWLVQQRLAFVGLREHWAASVCTFHALFRPRAAVHPAELAFTHAGPIRKVGQVDDSSGAHREYDEHQLRGFVDVHDEQVYATARSRFFADARRTGCAR